MSVVTTKTLRTGLEPALSIAEPLRSGHEPGFGHSVLDVAEALTNEVDAATGLPLRIRHRGDGAEMALVTAGMFIRGTNAGEPNQQPARDIWLDAFYIDVYPVSNQRYRQFVEFLEATNDHACCYPAEHLSSVTRELNHTPRLWARGVRGFSEDRLRKLGGEDQPVVTLTWYDAFGYAAWAGKLLPTEAQWEKAARGPDARLFPWGDNWDPRRLNSGLREQCTTAIDAYPQGVSPYGVYDMLGNVWEWCTDRYDRRGYVSGPTRNPSGPASGLDRVCRGGAWNYVSEYATATVRHAFGPSEAYEFVGFRTVMPVVG